MQSAKIRERTFFEKAKDRFRTALLAGSLLMPSAALAQERPQETHRQEQQETHRQEEHRHPESERFSPGPLLVLRSSAYRVAGALHEDIVNPRAVVPLNAGVSVTYSFQESSHRFFRYMLDPGRRNLSPALLSATLSAQYDYFRFRDLMSYNAEGVHEERELTGNGHAGSITPAIAIGAGFHGIPAELVLYGNFGYRGWSSRTDLALPGGASESVGTSSSEPYVGLYGLELRFPTLPCEPAFPLRLERIGVGAFGDAQNVFAYFTVSGNYMANHSFRARTLITPQITNFAGELSAGGEILPMELTFYLPRGLLSFAPGMRAEYNIHTSSPAFEAFGDIRYFPTHHVGFALRAGWIGQVHHHPEGEPSTGFGSLNLIFNVEGPGPSAPRSDIASSGG